MAQSDWMPSLEPVCVSVPFCRNSAWQRKCPRLSAATLIRESLLDQAVEVTVEKRRRPHKGEGVRKHRARGARWDSRWGSKWRHRFHSEGIVFETNETKIKKLADAAFIVQRIRDGGDSAQHALARKALQLVKQLRDDGCTVEDMQVAGFTWQQLYDGGLDCTVEEMRDAGYPATAMLDKGPWGPWGLMGPWGPRGRIMGFTALELLQGGVTVKQLRDEGCAAEWMRVGGFTAKQLHDGGYSARQMRAACLSAQQLRHAACSVQAMVEFGYAATELPDGGCGSFSAQELLDAGFSIQQMLDAGYTAMELLECGCSVEQMRHGGLTVHQLRTAGLSDAALSAAGFAVFTLRTDLCQFTGQVKVSCCGQDGSERASAFVNVADTLLQLTRELEGQLGESIILMTPSGLALGLEDDGRNQGEILAVLQQFEQEFEIIDAFGDALL